MKVLDKKGVHLSNGCRCEIQWLAGRVPCVNGKMITGFTGEETVVEHVLPIHIYTVAPKTDQPK